MFSSILLAQYPTILGPSDAPGPNPAILNLNYKLFQHSHVSDIVHNIRLQRATDIPLPDNLQIPKDGLHILTELGTRILRILTFDSRALCSVIRDLIDCRVKIDFRLSTCLVLFA